MRMTLTALTMAGLLTLGTQGFSQDTTETETQTPPPADALDLGEPVTADAEGSDVGQIYVEETYGDWEKRCLRGAEGEEDRCNLYQLLTNADDAPVAEFNLFRLPEGGQAVAGANVVVPLETLLTQQLTITINGGESRRYPFSFCNAAGCVARLGMTQGEIDQLKRGVSAVLRLVPAAAPEEEFLLNMSLNGFTAGYDSLDIVD
ncbi:invasion associated locus B family protein [Yoonia sp.]|uniref:invasion associated locus B family protein n=1 Tax=Yoonia sp. TaxID=2212373 RepID=UPI00391BFDCC